jgi:hypothetical protein
LGWTYLLVSPNLLALSFSFCSGLSVTSTWEEPLPQPANAPPRTLPAVRNIPRTKQRRFTTGDTVIGVLILSTEGQTLFATIATLKVAMQRTGAMWAKATTNYTANAVARISSDSLIENLTQNDERINGSAERWRVAERLNDNSC